MPEQLVLCSARGCRERAIVALRWRNPALHGAARTKQWVACPGHEQQLADFLDRRGFLLERASLSDEGAG
ncbi:MAG: hypothetical protein JO147_11920 [Actinobacteria bacterium]|nr:hypothetical protein [Actinomycetota bacterium]